jgi:hypothetical protein
LFVDGSLLSTGTGSSSSTGNNRVFFGDSTGWENTDVEITALSFTTQAVPIPAGAWLFGSGLLGLVGISTRKKVA